MLCLEGCKKDESVIVRPSKFSTPSDYSFKVPTPVDSVAIVDTVVQPVDTPVVEVPEPAPEPPKKVEALPPVKRKVILVTSRKDQAPKDTVDSLALMPTPDQQDSAEKKLCADVVQGEFCDPRDGKRYDLVVIGRQTWFRRNLAYETEGSWCPNDREENCTIYGRLYRWGVANSCPEGWRLPSMKDFTTLYDYIGKKNDHSEGVGTSLKTIVGWNDAEDGVPVGTNRYGFGAKPAGYRDSRGFFLSIGDEANFWTSNEVVGEDRASYWNLYYANADFIGSYVGLKSSAMSVRCIKN